jgi:hypothetical protein
MMGPSHCIVCAFTLISVGCFLLTYLRLCRRQVERGVFAVLSKLNGPIFQVTTLGQPLEVLKTQMAANRSQTMLQATKAVWARGGVAGMYQGLIPWVSGYLVNV